MFQISECGMVLEEQPHKVCEAMRLFLQGLGYGECFHLFIYLFIYSVSTNVNVTPWMYTYACNLFFESNFYFKK